MQIIYKCECECKRSKFLGFTSATMEKWGRYEQTRSLEPFHRNYSQNIVEYMENISVFGQFPHVKY